MSLAEAGFFASEKAATPSLSFNLKDFIDYAVNKSYGIRSSWSLTNDFAGFEIWSGGVGLKTTDFSVTVK
jgi:hypothetical protein